MSVQHTICLLGLGEVGNILAGDLAARGALNLVAWDWQFDNPDSLPSRHAHGHAGLRRSAAAGAAARNCDIVISAVTAAQDLNAALSVLPGLEAGAWFLDLNSVSPGAKREVADAVATAGGRYVEAAIMAPIAPRRSASPILAGGPHALAFCRWPMNWDLPGCLLRPDHWQGSRRKMCRSVVIEVWKRCWLKALWRRVAWRGGD
jgi:3-hydroxyisobutyrate dehydrogenase-like beta-hydroxyacid dehydrogenase